MISLLSSAIIFTSVVSGSQDLFEENVVAQLEDLIGDSSAIDEQLSEEYSNMRRLLTTAPTKDPTMIPLLQPTVSPTSCACFLNHEAGKLTNIEMAIWHSDDNTDITEADKFAGSDVEIDGTDAENWCKNKFGPSSYALWPRNLLMYQEMMEMCTRKVDDSKCYFGMFRYADDYTSPSIASCESWKAVTAIDGQDTLSGNVRYLDWDANAGQSQCNWSPYNAAVSPKRHCMYYKYDTNSTGVFNRRLVVNQCDSKAHVICAWTDDAQALCQC